MSETPRLDKIVALARPYERVEHGREERVSGYRFLPHPASETAHLVQEHGWSRSDALSLGVRGADRVHWSEHNRGIADHKHETSAEERARLKGAT